MTKRTVKLNLKTSLPMNESFCDGKGNGILHAIRNEKCPFNATKCYVCGDELKPILMNAEKKYFLEHQCGNNTSVTVTAIGDSYDDCIEKYERYVISIKQAFTQR